MSGATEGLTLHVCVTCRQAGAVDDAAELRPGARLSRALAEAFLKVGLYRSPFFRDTSVVSHDAVSVTSR